MQLETLVIECGDGRVNASFWTGQNLLSHRIGVVGAIGSRPPLPDHLIKVVEQYGIQRILLTIHHHNDFGCGGREAKSHIQCGQTVNPPLLHRWIDRYVPNPEVRAHALAMTFYAFAPLPGMEVLTCTLDNTQQELMPVFYVPGDRTPTMPYWDGSFPPPTINDEDLPDWFLEIRSWNRQQLLQAQAEATRLNFAAGQSFSRIVVTDLPVAAEDLDIWRKKVGLPLGEPVPDANFKIFADPNNLEDAVAQGLYAFAHMPVGSIITFVSGDRRSVQKLSNVHWHNEDFEYFVKQKHASVLEVWR